MGDAPEGVRDDEEEESKKPFARQLGQLPARAERSWTETLKPQLVQRVSSDTECVLPRSAL